MMHFLTESTTHLRRLLINRGATIGSYRQFSFADGERGYRLSEEVKRARTAITASVLPDPASLFDIFALFRLLRENRSRPPGLVIPYFAYARQERATDEGEAAIGIMVAELLRNLNPSEIRVFDIRSTAVLEALGPNAVADSALPLLAEKLAKGGPPGVVVAPDQGAVESAGKLAALLDAPETAWIEKERPKPRTAVAKALHGRVKGLDAVILDDLIDTGATITEAVRMVSHEGAASIRVAAVHGVFSGNAREQIGRLPVRDILVTNSLPQPRGGTIKAVDISSRLMGSG